MRRYSSCHWLLLAALLGLASLMVAETQPAPWSRGVRMAVRLKPGEAAVARLSLGEVRHDHQRRGFFKIGILPLLVVEDAKVEVLEPDSLIRTLAAVPSLLTEKGKDLPIELRNFTLSLPGEPTPRLSASRVRLAGGTNWLLSGQVAWRMGTNVGEATQASLQVAGPQAGSLTVDRPNALSSVDLFPNERLSPTQPTSK